MPTVDEALSDPRGTAGEYVADILGDVLPDVYDRSLLPQVVEAGIVVLLGGSLIGAGIGLLLPELLAAFTGGPTARDIEDLRHDLRANWKKYWLNFLEGQDIVGGSIVPVLFDLPLGQLALAQKREAFMSDCVTTRNAYNKPAKFEWTKAQRLRQEANKAYCALMFEKLNQYQGLTPTGRIPRPSIEWIGSGFAQDFTSRYFNNLALPPQRDQWRLAVALEELPGFRFEQAGHMYCAFLRDSLGPMHAQLAELDRLYGMGRISPQDYKTVLNAVWGAQVFPSIPLRRFITLDAKLAPAANALVYHTTGKLPNENLWGPSADETRTPKQGGPVLEVVAGVAAAAILGGA